MILCLDAGNTTIHGGVFNGSELVTQFRKMSKQQFSADEAGLFFKAALRENQVDAAQITGISICSVVPSINHSLRGACQRYLGIDPFFLRPGVKTGLRIKYRNPLEVGADRIANAIAGVNHYPDRNLVIIDFGTATTFCVISKEKDYLGGIIVPGVRISMEALERETAQLPVVEIVEPETLVGRSTVESIQSGLYHGQVGMVRELLRGITHEAFGGEKPLVIGTGGFSRLFESAGLFDQLNPTLVLEGLNSAYTLNHKTEA